MFAIFLVQSRHVALGFLMQSVKELVLLLVCICVTLFNCCVTSLVAGSKNEPAVSVPFVSWNFSSRDCLFILRKHLVVANLLLVIHVGE